MTITNPPVGKFINWHTALTGDPAMSAQFGAPLVKTFNHLRRYRAMEYIASYSGRCDHTLNGNDANEFHVISRFPVRASGDDAQAIITAKLWRRGYAAGNETWEWYKDYTDGAADDTLYSAGAVSNTVTEDAGIMHAHGPGYEFAVDIEPQAINTDDGFRCSRLDVSNAMIHRLNVFGCPHDPTLEAGEALVSLSDVSVGRVLQGWDEGNDDGTIGTLCHYMDGDSSEQVTGTDSVIHNTSRALFNTAYALGVYQTGVAAPGESLRQDSDGGAQTYRVKPRNLTGSGDKVPCDPAIIVYGGAGCVVTFSSSVAVDSVSYTIPGGGLAAPTLVTVSDFTGQLEIDDELDYVTVSGTSAGGIELYVQAVSLWEPHQYR